MNDFVSYSKLYHYGIPGMHWGIRRYQNPDGSLTDLGRKHKQQEEDAINEHYRRQIDKSNKRIESYNKKSSKRSKEKIKLEKASIKAYKELAKKEIDKVMKMSYKDLSDERRKRHGMALAETALDLLLFGPLLAPVLNSPDLNYLTLKERDKIINKYFKSDKSSGYFSSKNAVKRKSQRFINHRPKK